MSTTTVPGVRRSRMDRDEAARLAPAAYERLLQDLRDLDDKDWKAQTECPGWDVRDMAGHVVGMAAMASSLRETMRQDKLARKAGGDSYIDALTDLQVREQAGYDTPALLERFAEVWPRAARWRMTRPRPMRWMPLQTPQVVGEDLERWSTGYLIEVILTRDTWMHRMDISRATGRPTEVTPDHDGRIVADVVDEWAERHGQPFRLELTGPAGGSFANADVEPLVMDAVDFCRVLSGREADHPVEHVLLGTLVPF